MMSAWMCCAYGSVGIPMRVSSRVPVCRWVMKMAVLMGYGMGCMPAVVTGASVALGLMA